MLPGRHSSCQFIRQVTGSGGTEHVNTVTASGTDQFGNSVSGHGEREGRHHAPADRPRSRQERDLAHAAQRHGQLLAVRDEQGARLGDERPARRPAPAGITYLTATPSQGTCNVAPALVTCDLGRSTRPAVTIAITAKATSVGSHINTATVTGTGARDEHGRQHRLGETVVPAPLKPPTVNPKPQPLPRTACR